MYRSCSTCGRIHRFNEPCPNRTSRKRGGREEDRFRSSAAWQQKREQIKVRDLYLCRICLDENGSGDKYGFNSKGLSVHHIEPIHECWGRRLEDENLITLCSHHHELAECGRISRERLHELARKDVIGNAKLSK